MRAIDIAFSDAVKSVQARKGSRGSLEKRDLRSEVDETLAAFIATRTSFYLGTASIDGQPYIQHRGGPAGFLKVLDRLTLGFADFRGNRQYITLGNLSENPKAFIFLMDYENRQRVKIWGEATVVDGDDPRVGALFPDGYKARADQAILFKVKAWDPNCPQHIPQMFNAEAVAAAIHLKDKRIAELEAELAALKGINP